MAAGVPRVGNAFGVEVRNALPNGLGALAIGVPGLGVPVPQLGITVYPNSIDGFVGLRADSQGAVALDASPATGLDAGLVGMEFAVQAFFSDPGAVAEVSATAGLAVRIGAFDSAPPWLFPSPGFLREGFTPIVVAGDFNGDLSTDLAAWDDGSVWVRLGSGDGGFGPRLVLSGDEGLRSLVASGDLDADGRDDLVGLDDFGPLVWLSNGDGTFASPTSWAAPDIALAYRFAHVDGDPHLDLVAGLNDGTLVVYLGDGTGGFRATVTTAMTSAVEDVDVTDWNEDGVLDVVATLRFDAPQFLFGIGDGSFAPPFDPLPLSSTDEVAIADLDGDSHDDVVTRNSQSLRIRFGDGTGGAGTSEVVYSAPSGFLRSIDIGDFDDDGAPDILVALDTSASRDVFVLENQGDRSFLEVPGGRVGDQPRSVHAVPVDADGTLDAVFASDAGVEILFGDGDGGFETFESVGDFFFARTSTVGDVDSDGLSDVVLGTFNGETRVFLGDGDSIQPGAVSDGGVEPVAMQLVDLDGDGVLDLVTANDFGSSPNARAISVSRGTGDGSFTDLVELLPGTNARDCTAHDFNGDGNADVAVLESGGVVRVLAGNGEGSLTEGASVFANFSSNALACADIDHDGHPDLVTANPSSLVPGSGSVSILLGLGDGSFAAPYEYLAGVGPERVRLADLDGDGALEVVVSSNSQITVLRGLGAGLFGPPVSFSASLSGNSFELVDIDGDGACDAVVGMGNTVSSVSQDRVAILRGLGDGSFEHAGHHASGEGTADLAVFDIDGDGDRDVVSVGRRSVSVLRNATVR